MFKERIEISINSLMDKENLLNNHCSAQGQAINRWLETMETINDQTDYIYIDSNIEELESDVYNF